nr:hypothetical protein Iba_scaffold1979CG0080 [Ipomoea batatas]
MWLRDEERKGKMPEMRSCEMRKVGPIDDPSTDEDVGGTVESDGDEIGKSDGEPVETGTIVSGDTTVGGGAKGEGSVDEDGLELEGTSDSSDDIDDSGTSTLDLALILHTAHQSSLS